MRPSKRDVRRYRGGMVTPDDIRRARFGVSARGYNIAEVDQFLDRLIEEASAAGSSANDGATQQRIQSLEAKIDRLTRENADLRHHLTTQEPERPRRESPKSTLEVAYDRMSSMPGSEADEATAGSRSQDTDDEWSGSAIVSSLESSLFGFHEGDPRR